MRKETSKVYTRVTIPLNRREKACSNLTLPSVPKLLSRHPQELYGGDLSVAILFCSSLFVSFQSVMCS